jgi:hypothetical protein
VKTSSKIKILDSSKMIMGEAKTGCVGTPHPLATQDQLVPRVLAYGLRYTETRAVVSGKSGIQTRADEPELVGRIRQSAGVEGGRVEPGELAS